MERNKARNKEKMLERSRGGGGKHWAEAKKGKRKIQRSKDGDQRKKPRKEGSQVRKPSNEVEEGRI